MLTVKSCLQGAIVSAGNGREFLVQELVGGKASDTKVVAKLVADVLREGGAPVDGPTSAR